MMDFIELHAAMCDYADLGPKEAGDFSAVCFLMAIRLMLEHGETEAEIRSHFDDALERQTDRREN